MKTLLFKLAFPVAILAAGCIRGDYEGEYDMTYDVVMSPAGFEDEHHDVRAGLADVSVRDGLTMGEYLLDLGGNFCLLEGETRRTWPNLEIAPQGCFFASGGKVYTLEVAGSASFDNDRLTVVLAGSYVEEESRARGSATIELTESW